MGDAEVIPLGTRGRPGRGTGSAKPSAAARNLAGSARPRPAIPAPSGPPEAEAPVATPVSTPVTTPGAGSAPPPGIPVGDWLHAVTSAAVEVFGDRWEQRLAEVLAFLRR